MEADPETPPCAVGELLVAASQGIAHGAALLLF
jgi:hypothetical protein